MLLSAVATALAMMGWSSITSARRVRWVIGVESGRTAAMRRPRYPGLARPHKNAFGVNVGLGRFRDSGAGTAEAACHLMYTDRTLRMMKDAMGPDAPLTRAEERAALAGTITLIVVAAVAMLEILFSRAPAQRPPGRSPAPVHASPAAHAGPAMPALQAQPAPKVSHDPRAVR